MLTSPEDKFLPKKDASIGKKLQKPDQSVQIPFLTVHFHDGVELMNEYVSYFLETRDQGKYQSKDNHNMSALFNFHSFLTVVLLGICACTYVKMHFPALLEQRTGFRGFFWKAARIGERLSPWVAIGCFTMGVSIIFF